MAIISRIFENATTAIMVASAGDHGRIAVSALQPGSAPHLTCCGAADKRVFSDGQAGIVDMIVDDPVQNPRRARGGHEAIGNSFGGGGVPVIVPDSNCIG
jgi:hypothetical protein